MTDDILNFIDKSINKLEHSLGIDEGFHQSLLETDDWAFTLKTCTLLESATTHTIVSIIGFQELEEFFSKLPHHQRLKVLSDLGILNKDQSKHFALIASIRNAVVHNIQNHQFTLESYFTEMHEDKRKEWTATFKDHIQAISNQEDDFTNVLLNNSKSIIWHATLIMLWHLWSEAEIAKKIFERNRNIIDAVKKGEPIPKLKRKS